MHEAPLAFEAFYGIRSLYAWAAKYRRARGILRFQQTFLLFHAVSRQERCVRNRLPKLHGWHWRVYTEYYEVCHNEAGRKDAKLLSGLHILATISVNYKQLLR